MPKQVHQPGETDSDQSFPKISTGSRFQLSPPSARLAIVVGEPSKTGHVIRVKRPAIPIEPLSVVPSERNVDARRAQAGLGIVSTATVAMPTLIANLALEINLIAARFVDTPSRHQSSVADYRANAEDVAQDIADAEVKIACPMMSLWGAYFYAVGTMFDVPKVWREMASNLVPRVRVSDLP